MCDYSLWRRLSGVSCSFLYLVSRAPLKLWVLFLSAGAISIGAISSPSPIGEACPWHKVSFSIVATIRKSCFQKIGPLVFSTTFERGGHRCSSDSFIWEFIVILQVLTIVTFCSFPIDGANLMVLSPSTLGHLFPSLPVTWPANRTT